MTITPSNLRTSGKDSLAIRAVVQEDLAEMQGLISATPEFDEGDISTCMECLDAYLKGDKTYYFVCVENEDRLIGFMCYGQDSIAEKVYELYWIVVARGFRRKGVARALNNYLEDAARENAIRAVFIETESDPAYAKARGLYEACGYIQRAIVPAFYSNGNDKIIYGKNINHGRNKEPEHWKTLISNSVERPSKLPDKHRIKVKEIDEVTRVFPMRVNPYYLSLIEEENDPIWKQCIPDPLELEDFGLEDPLNEEGDSPVPGLVHRYPDRVLLLVSNQCAMYCRFCTRKRRVGNPLKQITMDQIMKGIEYIRNTPQIRDVILSGGDPFMLSDTFLEAILKELKTINHVEIVRIGTRVPCTLPQRVTPELCAMLQKYHPLYINTHFNHPREITPESAKACAMLADAGIPLGSQTVLLKGVNDDPEVMRELMQKLISIRVRPYYIYQCDIARGNEHFRTQVAKGVEIIDNIRGHTSGLCVPHFVIDAPGGGGKIPLLPEYVVESKEDKIILRNYRNQRYEYPEPIIERVQGQAAGEGQPEAAQEPLVPLTKDQAKRPPDAP